MKKRTFAKTIVSVLIGAALAACFLSACKSEGETGASSSEGEKRLSVVTTIFPLYDWAANIMGNEASGADLTMLVDKGVDLHSYQPTVDDILTISNADVFLYVGGESDEWVEDALNESADPDRIVVNLLDALGSAVKEEEQKEGMEEERGSEEETAYDEHVWLSLKNASVLCEAIKEALCKADPANQDLYESNCRAYLEKLSALDREYEAAAAASPLKTLVFGDRFPFLYLTDDYGLDYYAAFAGCSAETEASFETILFLAGKIDELGLPAVLTIEDSGQKIAETIVKSTKTKDQEILSLDSLQSVTEKDLQEGKNYLSAMKDNLEVLKEALR